MTTRAIHATAATDQGDRDSQQDRFLIADTPCCACGAPCARQEGGGVVRCAHCTHHNKPAREHTPSLLAAVADGLGGHQGGDRAAEKAILVLQRHIASAVARCADPVASLAGAFLAAHRAVARLGRCSVTGTREHKMSCHCRPPGTTLTALWLYEGRAFVGHVGDSRCYQVVDGALVQVTRDHVIWGDLSQCIGQRGEDPDPQIVEVPAKGRYLICSDGLTGVLRDDQIARMAWDAGLIVHEAIDAGKAKDAERSRRQDNTTVVLIDLGEGGDGQA